jgi:hypothetical protein
MTGLETRQVNTEFGYIKKADIAELYVNGLDYQLVFKKNLHCSQNKKSQVFLLDLMLFFEFDAKFYLVCAIDIYENCATIRSERQKINSKYC